MSNNMSEVLSLQFCSGLHGAAVGTADDDRGSARDKAEIKRLQAELASMLQQLQEQRKHMASTQHQVHELRKMVSCSRLRHNNSFQDVLDSMWSIAEEVFLSLI
jgi:hypothetical protein